MKKKHGDWRDVVRNEVMDAEGKTFADRTLKPIAWVGSVVDTVKDAITGNPIEIRYNKNRKKFFFKHGEIVWYSDEMKPLFEAARFLTAEERVLIWKPVIIIKQSENDWGHHKSADLIDSQGVYFPRHALGIAFARVYLSHNPQLNQLRWLDWDKYAEIEKKKGALKEKERVDASRYVRNSVEKMPDLPWVNPERERETWLEYSDALYDRLVKMGESLDWARDELTEMLKPERVHVLNSGNPLKLLGDGNNE